VSPLSLTAAAAAAPTGAGPIRALLVLAVVAALALVLWLMRRAWRAKAAGQSTMAAPESLPESLAGSEGAGRRWVGGPTPARYLGTSPTGDWLSRIVVHDLGVPSQALLAVDDTGVWIERQGARSFFVPRSDVVGARSDRAIAGRAYESHGVTLLSWRLGDCLVDSGFRIVGPQDQADLIAAIDTLVLAPQPTGDQS
jgi:hypothetical protein